MEDIFDTIVARAADISASHPLVNVISGRGNIIELTENSHDAVLIPKPPGGLSHSERAALACRIARLNKEDLLAQHYENMIESKDALPVADAALNEGFDARLKAITQQLRHERCGACRRCGRRAGADDVCAAAHRRGCASLAARFALTI